MARKKKTDKQKEIEQFDETWDAVNRHFEPVPEEELSPKEGAKVDELIDKVDVALDVTEEDPDAVFADTELDHMPADDEEGAPDDYQFQEESPVKIVADEYQAVSLTEILDITNKAMFDTVEPKVVSPAELEMLKEEATKLLQKAVSGKDMVVAAQMRHWQKFMRGELPWGWVVEED